MTTPEVSVIMPVYNASASLQRALQSVFAQSFERWEIIAVNDGSTDNSAEILAKNTKSEPRLRVFNLAQNSGAAIARNKAIEEAKGRYIAFLDSDDEWLPQKLEEQIGFMMANNYAFSCTAYERLRHGEIVSITKVPAKANYQQVLRNNTVGALTAVYDAQILGKNYMPNIRRRQDYALWLKLLEITPYVYGINKPLARYHMGHNSLSSNKLKAAQDQWRFYRDTLNLNLPKRIWYFSNYAFHASQRNRG